MRCTSPSAVARSTGQKRPGRSFTTSTPRATSSVSKSCPQARAGHPETGKKRALRERWESALPNSGEERSRPALDLGDPKVRADLRQQAKMTAQHPENDAIDDWIEAAYDWSAWK